MDKTAGAIDYYHELLAGSHLDSTQDWLSQATREQRLSFGSRAVCTVLRPFFIDEETYKFVTRASRLVMRALAAIGRRLFLDENLRRELDLTAEEEQIALIETGYGPPDVSARLDGFLGEAGEFNFVEYNAESPGGLAYGDALADAFARMPVMKEFGNQFAFRSVPVRERVFDRLIDAFHRWGGRGLPNIAIVDWRGVSTYNEFLLMQSYFLSRGCRVRIADPDELEYKSGRLFVEDFAIDLVYKRVVTGELLAKYGLAHPLIDAARDRAVCLSNGFGVQMLYKKAIFALASDPRYDFAFDDETAAAIRIHIPWTRKVRERKTDYENREVDLIEFIADNRERLVLKPNGEYGGKGVLLGWECEDERWNEAINDALDDSWVVQERVPLARQMFPSIIDGRLQTAERYFDLDPYVWDGSEVEGFGVRLSSLALLNVSAGGGSATPMFVINRR
jgi:uncharacterized circularly permuted ATP-grasp superfamily protein